MSQIYKPFTTDQVKELLARYLRNEIERKYVQVILRIEEWRFFDLLKQHKENPDRFSIHYRRSSPPRTS